jgi:hypothetical protein
VTLDEFSEIDHTSSHKAATVRLKRAGLCAISPLTFRVWVRGFSRHIPTGCAAQEDTWSSWQKRRDHRLKLRPQGYPQSTFTALHPPWPLLMENSNSESCGSVPRLLRGAPASGPPPESCWKRTATPPTPQSASTPRTRPSAHLQRELTLICLWASAPLERDTVSG